MKFSIQHRDPGSSARDGSIEAAHDTIQTPIFMPVGTQGTVKENHQKELEDVTKAQIILG